MIHNRFTKEQAIHICERTLPPRIGDAICPNCYYFDGRCELGCIGVLRCENYVPDNFMTNRVRKNILNNYEWCVENFNKFCIVDKELFIAIWDVELDYGVISLKNGDESKC